MATTETQKTSGTVMTEQLIGRAEITLELVSGGKADMLIDKDVNDNGSQYASVEMTRAELWEHVHNCLGLLAQMPEESS